MAATRLSNQRDAGSRARGKEGPGVRLRGQQGVLLRGKGDDFEVIPRDATRDQLWGKEWFKDNLYLAADDPICRLDAADGLEELDLWEVKTCGHLHANDGVMWSFGTKHVASTEDGRAWHDVTP